MFDNEDFELDEELLKVLDAGVAQPTVKNVTSNRTIHPSSIGHKIKNTSAMTTNITRQTILKRKFPGPAGLFSECNQTPNKDVEDTPLLNSEFLSTQPSNATSEKITWQEVCKDFNDTSMMGAYNIAWIKSNATQNLVDNKIPFLLAIVKAITNTSKTPIFVLADNTGEIEALISAELYEDYNEYFSIGCAIVLKLFSLLSITPLKNYINITHDNLVRIYSCKGSDSRCVKIVQVYESSVTEVEHEIKAFIAKKRSDIQTTSIENVPKQSNTQFHKSERKSNVNKNSNLQWTNKQQNSCANEKKCNIKDVLRSRCNVSNTATTATNMFECSSELADLDLQLIDFEGGIPLPPNTENSINSIHYYKESTDEDVDVKKRKKDCNRELDKDERNLTKNGETRSSQITVISHNKENTDVIKQMLSDVDLSALFGDF